MNRWTMGTWVTAALGLALAASQAQAGPKDDQLLQAVKNRNAAAIKALVGGGANPNFRFPDNSVALSWAVSRIDPEAVKALLAAGADPNAKDLDGANPLVLACEIGDTGLITQLLDAKANVNVTRFDRVTPLHICARTAAPAVVARLLLAGAAVDAVNGSQQTPLMFAAAAARVENIGPLIAAGAKVNATTIKGFTPLFFAIDSGSDPAVRALLDAGATVNYSSPDGITPLQLALYGYLAPGQGASDPVNRVATAKTLVQHGATLTGWDDIGRQPIHAAVLSRDVELVKLMLAKGADPNALSRLPYMLDPEMDNSGSGSKVRPRARDWAAVGYKPKIMVNKNPGGAAVQEPPEPASPLIVAAQAGSEEIMKVLVAAGAKPDFVTADKVDVVLAAAGSGKLNAVKYAVALHPKLDSVKEDGSSAIHMALSNARSTETPAILRYLANSGAPLDIRNKRGETPAQLAVRGAPAIRAVFEEIANARPPVAATPEERVAKN